MPEQGIDYVHRDSLLTFEEMVRLVSVAVELGIDKIRITGGEPFLRKDMMDFLSMISQLGLKEVHMTTNGTLTYSHIPQLNKLGVASINLSLDTLNAERFFRITRRNEFAKVMSTFHRLQEYEIPTKINMVVMEGQNTEDVLPMAKLAQEHPISVRFIEQMPFNGSGNPGTALTWDHSKILTHLQEEFPTMTKMASKPGATATNYTIKGFMGTVGIIAAYSRTFCGSCNRLRVTPEGTVRTCLYDEGVFNIRDLMRQGASNQQIKDTLIQAIGQRAKDGFEAESRRWNFVSESMSTIGG